MARNASDLKAAHDPGRILHFNDPEWRCIVGVPGQIDGVNR